MLTAGISEWYSGKEWPCTEMRRIGRIWKKRGQKQSRDMKQGGMSVHNSGFIPSCEFLAEVSQKQNV